MVKIFCVVVGKKRNAFSVDIDASEFVVDLKDAIKVENAVTITCDASNLNLYLARKEGSAWLKSDQRVLQRGEISAEIQQLLLEEPIDPLMHISRVFSEDQVLERIIQVLVKLLDDTIDAAALTDEQGFTYEWLQQFDAAYIPKESLVGIEELPEFLRSPLPVKIGVLSHTLAKWKGMANPLALKNLFEASDSKQCMTFLWRS